MDELDLTEKTPRAFETGPVGPPLTMPIEKIDIEPLATERAADGTRTRLPTAPPPIPARARRVSKPPPIPTAAFEKALPEPEIPVTIEPVVIRRSGTIPPPIPTAALRRPPTVPPVGAPSVEVSASVLAPAMMPSAPASAAVPTTMLVGPGASSAPEEADVGSLWPDIAPPSIAAPSSIGAPSSIAARPSSAASSMSASIEAAAPVVAPALDTATPAIAPPQAVAPALDASVAAAPRPAAPPLDTSVAASVAAAALRPPRSRRESAAVATLPEWPILDSAPAPLVDAPIAVPLPALPAPSSEWLHPKVATPPFVRQDPEIAATTYFERDEAPAPFVNRRYLAAAGVGAVTLVAIIALAMRGGGDETKVTTPAKRTHTHAITKAPAIATAPTTKPATSTTAAMSAEAKTANASTSPATAPDAKTTTPTSETKSIASSATAPTPETRTSATSGTPTASSHALTEVPISSWPQGATVTLVDDGNAKIIGRTPLTASLDPSRSYDVVLAVSGRPTMVRHLDPRTTHELAVDLDPDPAAPAKYEHAAPKHVAVAEPANHETAPSRITTTTPTHATTAPAHGTTTTPAHATPAHPAPTRSTAPSRVATTTPTPSHATIATPAKPTPGNAKPAQLGKLAPVDFDAPATASTGTLQVQSKPPCEILIDGKPTHLVTPQRAIPLSPGAHAVTLINTHDKIKKTVAVHIEAKRATRLAHDFTAQ